MVDRLKNILLYFSVVFFISGVSFFIAYNWSEMENMEKLAIPFSLITGGIGGWFLWETVERYRKISLFFSSFFIGTLFALFGQIYQTGADAYNLFLAWGFFIFIFSYVENFYPLWTLNVTVLTIGISLFARLHWGIISMLYASGIFVYISFLLYCLYIKRYRIEIKNWFFYLLATVSTGLISGGVGYYLLRKTYFSRGGEEFQNGFLIFLIYIVFLTSLFFLGEKIMKKQGLNILGIISAGTVVLNLSSLFLSRTSGGMIFHNLLTIGIFAGTIGIIRKKYAPTKSQRFVINYFKINLVFSLLFLASLIISFLGLRENSLLFMGIIFLMISLYLPTKLKFQGDKNEIVTLISGILCIIFYLLRGLKIGILPSILIGSSIYGLFWYFRHCKALDFLMIPAISTALFFISKDLKIGATTYIAMIPLILILFSICSKEVSPMLKRVVRGSEGTLMLSWIIFHGEILSVGTLLISLIILYKILKDERIWRFLTLAVILSVVGYLFINTWSINLAIMLILLYLYREEKYMLGIAVLFFAGQISFYYYKMDKTLLEKSYVMLKNTLLLSIAHTILRGKR